MRHRISGYKLGRSEDLRKALFRSLVSEFVLHGSIKTTETKAKAAKVFIDKLVTKAKKTTLAAQRDILRTLSKEATGMLIGTVVPKFANRTSGFSRIIKTGVRKGDNTEMVILEWTEQMQKPAITEGKLAKTPVAKKQPKSVVAKTAKKSARTGKAKTK